MNLPKVQNFRRRAAPIFSPGEIHRPKLRFLKLVEVLLIVLVLGGTTAAFINFKGDAVKNFFQSLPSKFSPQQEKKEVEVPVSFEDQLKINLVAASLKADTFQKTTEGDFLVGIGKTNIFFDDGKDSASQVSTLQTVLSKAKIEGRQIKKVDFRFENVVVEF
jgi:hypothetical protein